MICFHHFTSVELYDSDILKQQLLGEKYKLRAPRLKLGTAPIIFVLNIDENSDGNTTTKKSRSERIKKTRQKIYLSVSLLINQILIHTNIVKMRKSHALQKRYK